MPHPHTITTPAGPRHRRRKSTPTTKGAGPKGNRLRARRAEPAGSASAGETVRPWHYVVALIALLVTGLEAGG